MLAEVGTQPVARHVTKGGTGTLGGSLNRFPLTDTELNGPLFVCSFTRQVVDMRWGVRDEATDDHMTTELCMKEIDNCQRLSMGPNFVVSTDSERRTPNAPKRCFLPKE